LRLRGRASFLRLLMLKWRDRLPRSYRMRRTRSLDRSGACRSVHRAACRTSQRRVPSAELQLCLRRRSAFPARLERSECNRVPRSTSSLLQTLDPQQVSASNSPMNSHDRLSFSRQQNHGSIPLASCLGKGRWRGGGRRNCHLTRIRRDANYLAYARKIAYNE
jgi:hypothetical protein